MSISLPSPTPPWWHAAVLSATLAEAANWKLYAPYAEAAETAEVLADAVYEDRDPAEMAHLMADLGSYLTLMKRDESGLEIALSKLVALGFSPIRDVTALVAEADQALSSLNRGLCGKAA